MNTLGVFTSLYPDGAMTISRALLISAIGFLLVFAILGVIALFVKLMGTVFEKAGRKKSTEASPSSPVITTPKNTGGSLPDHTSAGELVLENVSEEDAAVIMAIISNKSGIPLNRLQFRSIRLLEETNQ